ncbi:abortive infection family protein [Phyllobacterium sp. TAF24]|uniref:abortive infection family protein n=1 Tax=Phyllobacterium sp. TAF24 TaxID=3233068 RepID=UPI003F983673
MTPIPPSLTQDLRTKLADAIAGFKAYDVPGVCIRLGLAEGSGEEAFNSKFKYANTRLAQVDAQAVLGMARKLLEEVDSFELAELAAKIDELGTPSVSEVTRRRIMAVFEGQPLASQIDDLELIGRVWPAEVMRHTTIGRNLTLSSVFSNSAVDRDWNNSDLLTQLGILTCSRAQLFRFLIEVTGPVAQKPGAQSALVTQLNRHIEHDGYQLVAAGKVSGSPIYEVRVIGAGSPADRGISDSLKAFDPNDVHNRWEAAVERRTDDPGGAITLARTLLEDVCKWILHEAGEAYLDKDDLPVLYKKLAKVLRLAPDDHTEQTFKQLLGSCQQIVELLGSLRNKLGDAHSSGPLKAKPKPRHAELAVNLSGTMATFLVDTWKARQSEVKN